MFVMPFSNYKNPIIYEYLVVCESWVNPLELGQLCKNEMYYLLSYLSVGLIHTMSDLMKTLIRNKGGKKRKGKSLNPLYMWAM